MDIFILLTDKLILLGRENGRCLFPVSSVLLYMCSQYYCLPPRTVESLSSPLWSESVTDFRTHDQCCQCVGNYPICGLFERQWGMKRCRQSGNFTHVKIIWLKYVVFIFSCITKQFSFCNSWWRSTDFQKLVYLFAIISFVYNLKLNTDRRQTTSIIQNLRSYVYGCYSCAVQ